MATTWKGLVNTVRCWRCGGLMVTEQCFDLFSDNGHLDFLAQRCVQCGELVDPVILHNRQVGPEAIPGRRRRRLSPAGVST